MSLHFMFVDEVGGVVRASLHVHDKFVSWVVRLAEDVLLADDEVPLHPLRPDHVALDERTDGHVL